VIVDCGFGGLLAAKALRRTPADVRVIDRHNNHLFQRLRYPVASAALAPADIAQPLRSLLREQKNVRGLAEVEHVDLQRRRVRAGGREVLIEAGARLLPALSVDASARALAERHELGVAVRLGDPVMPVRPDGVEVAGGHSHSCNVIWAVGAVIEIGRLGLGGLLAWLARMALHITVLIGLRNRLAVLSSWICSYVFFRRGSRLITRTEPPAAAGAR
jgi:NADH dehydrogenase FAD-containing subunit